MYSKQENLVINEITRTTKQRLNHFKTTSGNNMIIDYYCINPEKFKIQILEIKNNIIKPTKSYLHFGSFKVVKIADKINLCILQENNKTKNCIGKNPNKNKIYYCKNSDISQGFLTIPQEILISLN